MRWAIVAVGLAAGVSGAQAQSLNFADRSALNLQPRLYDGTPVNAANTFFDVLTLAPGFVSSSGQQIYERGTVNLGDVIAAAGGVTQPQLSLALAGIAARLDRLSERFSEGVALAGSINVLPPNPGDRFAVSVGGAGYNGAGAASISASARIGDDTLIYGAIARGPTQTMVKGGLGWSFR